MGEVLESRVVTRSWGIELYYAITSWQLEQERFQRR